METQLTRLDSLSLPGPVDEPLLLKRARAGDREAFRTLVLHHQARVFGVALHLASDRAEALELSHDTFIQLHAALARIAAPSQLTRWLLREVILLAGQRRQTRAHEAPRRGAEVSVGGKVFAPESAHELLPQLPIEARAVLLLRYQEGLELAEIAAVTETPVAAVQSQLDQSLTWLQTHCNADVAHLERCLRVGLAAPDPGPEFTARVVARMELRRTHRQRAAFRQTRSPAAQRRRVQVLGITAIVLAGIAAALLFTRYRESLMHPVVARTLPVAPAPAAAPAPIGPQQVEAPPDAAAPASNAAESQANLRDALRRYTLIVMPLRQDAVDPSAAAPIDAFYAALLDELRKVPGLTLLIPGVTAPPAEPDSPADYLLTVRGLPATSLPSGGKVFHFADGWGGITAPGSSSLQPSGALSLRSAATSIAREGSTPSSQRWPVEIRIQPLGPPISGSFASVLQIGSESPTLPAAQLAEGLRAQFFPDAQLTQQMLARIRDASLPADARNQSLSELINSQARGRGPGLEAAGIGIIVDYAAALRADRRAQLWRNLRVLNQPDLVAPLVDSLRHDPDEEVRFEALATLAANYGTDARVREALQAVMQEDSEQVIRMAAQRVLQGEAVWRSYVAATLANTELMFEDRLAPLLYAARSAATPAEQRALRDLVADRQISSLLAGMVRDGWFDATQADSTHDALALLAGAASPAGYDLSITLQPDAVVPPSSAQSQQQPQPQPQPPQRPQPQIAPETMQWLVEHRNIPRVRRLLQQIDAGNVDPQLLAQIELLQRIMPPRR